MTRSVLRRVGWAAGSAILLFGGFASLIWFNTASLGPAIAHLWPPVSKETIVAWSVGQNSDTLRRIGTSAEIGVQIPRNLVLAEFGRAFAEAREKKDLPASVAGAAITYGDPVFSLGEQHVAIRLPATLTLPQVRITVEAVAVGAPAVDSDTLHIAVQFESLEIGTVEARTFWLWPGEVLRAEINRVLRDFLGAANSAFNDHYNPIVAPIRRPPVLDTNLRENQTDVLQFDDRPIYLNPAIADAAILVDSEGARVIATSRFRTREAAEADASRLPEALAAPNSRNVPSSSDEVTRAFTVYRDGFATAYAAAFDRPVPQVVADKPELAISRRVIARMLNSELATPITGQASYALPPSSFSEAIRLSEGPSRDCRREVAACQSRDLCRNRQACASRLSSGLFSVPGVEEVEERVCGEAGQICNPVTGILSGGLACVPRVLCEVQKVQRNVVRQVANPALAASCDALAPLVRDIPGVCELADQADRLPCNVLEEAGVLACQAHNATLGALAANPLATISGNYSGSIGGRLALGGSVSERLETLALNLMLNAQGRVSATLRFEPESIRLLDASCAFNSEGTVRAQVSANGRLSAQGVVSAYSSGRNLTVRFSLGDVTIPVDLDKSPFTALFGENPQMLLTCRLLGAAAAAFGAWDTLVTERLRRVSPYVSGRGIPVPLKDVNIDIRVEPIGFFGIDLPASLGPNALVFAPR